MRDHITMLVGSLPGPGRDLYKWRALKDEGIIIRIQRVYLYRAVL